MTSVCLGCFKPMEGESHFHPSCCRRLFGTGKPPEIPYRREEIAVMAARVVRASVTVPGVQPKLSMEIAGKMGREEKGRFTLIGAGMEGRFILKLPVGEYPFLPENEALTMVMANAAGIMTVPFGLLPMKSGERAFVCRRVDRTVDDRRRGFIPMVRHMEDMAQLTGKLTEQKYLGSMEQVGRKIREFSSTPGFDLTRFLDLTLFIFLTGNGDMHLKNFSLLRLQDGSITFAPAYDLLSTRLVITERQDPDDLALTLNGKRRKLRLGDFKIFARTLGLTEKQFSNAFARLAGKLPVMAGFLEAELLPPSMGEAYRDILSSRASRLEMTL